METPPGKHQSSWAITSAPLGCWGHRSSASCSPRACTGAVLPRAGDPGGLCSSAARRAAATGAHGGWGWLWCDVLTIWTCRGLGKGIVMLASFLRSWNKSLGNHWSAKSRQEVWERLITWCQAPVQGLSHIKNNKQAPKAVLQQTKLKCLCDFCDYKESVRFLGVELMFGRAQRVWRGREMDPRQVGRGRGEGGPGSDQKPQELL